MYVPCSYCGKQFIDIHSFNVHRKVSHASSSVFICKLELDSGSVCHRRYNEYNSFRKHLILGHGVPVFASERSPPLVQPDNGSAMEDNLMNAVAECIDQGNNSDLSNVCDLSTVEGKDAKELLRDEGNFIVAKFYANPIWLTLFLKTSVVILVVLFLSIWSM